MSKISFIAQFPPPIHGLSKAVETLYESRLKPKFNFNKINITSNKTFVKSFISILFSRSDVYYFTIAQTKKGNLRDLVFLELLKYKKGKTLVHLHGGYYRTLIEKDCSESQRKANVRLLKNISGAIVLGESLDYIFKGLVDDSKIFTVPNCVDDQYLLTQENLEKKLNQCAHESVLKVLYLSNFIEAKGYKEVLELAKTAKNNDAAFEFHFAGKFFDTADEEFFHSYIAQNKLDNVKYHGIVSGKAKINMLQMCHMFILLTRYLNEGQPISILEAMGNGMSVITTNHAGIPDVVSNNTNGFVSDKDNIDVDKVYEYMTMLYNDRALLIHTSQNNYRDVVSHYTENKYIDNMDAIFTKLVQ